ncbi:hypothetical protein SK571_23545 [Lentzea sp. BCCO 10_0798]|jgi:hypothetical protein|uniref:Uncharacterized protein n=1 Tax=Lentzea kristufekii TaxID=3095430 RepID=A0ABU4TVN5_9PSEU|nr:hypothetical protein [Lentzea sp. BCCO 10_0798]MDX8052372.1 hypothetical protein [Lentzea sp. BCCO 10_0798]
MFALLGVVASGYGVQMALRLADRGDGHPRDDRSDHVAPQGHGLKEN